MKAPLGGGPRPALQPPLGPFSQSRKSGWAKGKHIPTWGPQLHGGALPRALAACFPSPGGAHNLGRGSGPTPALPTGCPHPPRALQVGPLLVAAQGTGPGSRAGGHTQGGHCRVHAEGQAGGHSPRQAGARGPRTPTPGGCGEEPLPWPNANPEAPTSPGQPRVSRWKPRARVPV